MLILNTLTIIIQFAFIILVYFVSVNILHQFTGSVRTMSVFAPALFVNHGGGPLPLLGDEDHKPLTRYLRNEAKDHLNLNEIKAVIVVTAHWVEEKVTISSSKHHKLYFDYYGFPAQSYQYRYDAPGDPDLAERIHEAFKDAGVKSLLDPDRGWDHGVFVPMMLINPAADVPIVQVSVLKSHDAAQHYKIGEVLHQFRKEGIAILGSGMSYHNMQEFHYSRGKGYVINEEFDEFLNKVCTANAEKKKQGLLSWKNQPGGVEAHLPHSAEHFMPLVVVAAAGGSDQGKRVFHWDMGKTFRLSGFLWKKES